MNDNPNVLNDIKNAKQLLEIRAKGKSSDAKVGSKHTTTRFSQQIYDGSVTTAIETVTVIRKVDPDYDQKAVVSRLVLGAVLSEVLASDPVSDSGTVDLEALTAQNRLYEIWKGERLMPIPGSTSESHTPWPMQYRNRLQVQARHTHAVRDLSADGSLDASVDERTRFAIPNGLPRRLGEPKTTHARSNPDDPATPTESVPPGLETAGSIYIPAVSMVFTTQPVSHERICAITAQIRVWAVAEVPRVLTESVSSSVSRFVVQHVGHCLEHRVVTTWTILIANVGWVILLYQPKRFVYTLALIIVRNTIAHRMKRLLGKSWSKRIVGLDTLALCLSRVDIITTYDVLVFVVNGCLAIVLRLLYPASIAESQRPTDVVGCSSLADIWACVVDGGESILVDHPDSYSLKVTWTGPQDADIVGMADVLGPIIGSEVYPIAPSFIGFIVFDRRQTST